MTLQDEVRGLLETCLEVLEGSPSAAAVKDAHRRLDGPLTVAVAGMLSAGKSTLLNALVGERLAATDATECTTIVTWYVAGPATRAWAHLRSDPPRQVRYLRDAKGTHLDLQGLPHDQIERLEVQTPNGRLARLNLVDTPGLASDTPGVSRRTQELLLDGGPGVDAVIYLMRHVHASDVGFLESFADEQFAGTAPVNAIGVLSRADEVAGGSAQTLDIAEGIAARYRADPRVRAVVQTVVPVSGLLALAADALTEDDYAALARVAVAPTDVLLSTDRFLSAGIGLPQPECERLLMSFGMFGMRYCTGLIRQGTVTGAAALARHLQAACGLQTVRELLLDRFMRRAGVLKADGALRVLESVLDGQPAGAPPLANLKAQLQTVLAGAHELTELRTLTALRTGELELDDPALRDEAERLLGVEGTSTPARLALAPDASEQALRSAAIAALRRWQRLAQHPLAGGGTRRVADVLRRTCEGLL